MTPIIIPNPNLKYIAYKIMKQFIKAIKTI